MNAETNTSVARLARNVSTVTFQAGTILRSRPPTPLRLHSGNESHRRDLSVPHRIARACTTHVQRRAGQNRPPGQYGSRARPIISNNCSTSIIAPSIHQYYTPRFTSQTDAKIIFKLSSAPPPVLPRSTLYECIPFDFFFFFIFYYSSSSASSTNSTDLLLAVCATRSHEREKLSNFRVPLFLRQILVTGCEGATGEGEDRGYGEGPTTTPDFRVAAQRMDKTFSVLYYFSAPPLLRQVVH